MRSPLYPISYTACRVHAVTTVTYDNKQRQQPMHHGVSSWDQGPINNRVLHGPRHPKDNLLVLIDRPLHVRCGKADGTRCVLESDNVDQSTGACAGGPTTGAVSLHKAFYATIYHMGWAILEGFEFRCFATGGTEYGAAVDINTGKVILRDNLFRQNAARW